MPKKITNFEAFLMAQPRIQKLVLSIINESHLPNFEEWLDEEYNEKADIFVLRKLTEENKDV